MEEKYGHFRREERDKRRERGATMWRGRGIHPPPVNPSNMHNGYVYVQANT